MKKNDTDEENSETIWHPMLRNKEITDEVYSQPFWTLLIFTTFITIYNLSWITILFTYQNKKTPDEDIHTSSIRQETLFPQMTSSPSMTSFESIQFFAKVKRPGTKKFWTRYHINIPITSITLTACVTINELPWIISWYIVKVKSNGTKKFLTRKFCKTHQNNYNISWHHKCLQIILNNYQIQKPG